MTFTCELLVGRMPVLELLVSKCPGASKEQLLFGGAHTSCSAHFVPKKKQMPFFQGCLLGNLPMLGASQATFPKFLDPLQGIFTFETPH